MSRLPVKARRSKKQCGARCSIYRRRHTHLWRVGKRLGNANASRAVGLANGRNPIGIIVPCHRVIGANGSLTGYAGGLERKQWLLAHEQQFAPRTQLGMDLVRR